MNFLSVLGKVGKGILGGLTGGGGIDYGKLAETIGSVTSGAAKGSADQRNNDAQLQALFNQQAMTTARDQATFGQQAARDTYQSQIDGAKFGASEQERAKKNAILASLMGGMQDLKLTPGNPAIAAAMGQRSGGARPSAMTGNKEALMALLGRPEIAAPEFTPAPGYQAPNLPGMPTAGMGEKVLGGVGLGGSILGALGGLRGLKKPDPMSKYRDNGYATGY